MEKSEVSASSKRRLKEEESKFSMDDLKDPSDNRKSKHREEIFEELLQEAESSVKKKNLEEEEEDEDEDDEEEEEEDESYVIHQEDMIFNPESGLRNWLKSRGKEHCIDFEDEELRQLRNYFGSLDDDGSGSIGVDELEDPLIALGLVDNRQQVQSIVRMVDDDGSEMIEFPEFLSIIKGGSNAVSTFL